jgi:hypothetical protein
MEEDIIMTPYESKMTLSDRNNFLEKFGIKVGDKFKLHHYLHENQNVYADMILTWDGNNIVWDFGEVSLDQLIYKLMVGHYTIEKIL